jgi:hypothetical protein
LVNTKARVNMMARVNTMARGRYGSARAEASRG